MPRRRTTLTAAVVATVMGAAGAVVAMAPTALAAAETMSVTTTGWSIGPSTAGYNILQVRLSNGGAPSGVSASYVVRNHTGSCRLDKSGTLVQQGPFSWWTRTMALSPAGLTNDCAGHATTVTVTLHDQSTHTTLTSSVKTYLRRRVVIRPTKVSPKPVRRYHSVTPRSTMVRASWDTKKYEPLRGATVVLQRHGLFHSFQPVRKVRATGSGVLRAAVKVSAYECWRYSYPGTSKSWATTPSAEGCAVVTGPTKASKRWGPAGNFQEDAQHDGKATGPGLPTSLHKLWSRKPAAASDFIGYPVIAGGRVFMAGTRTRKDGFVLYYVDAYAGRTGKLLWSSKSIVSNATLYPLFSAALAYDHGKVFLVDALGQRAGFSAKTGTQLWAKTKETISLVPAVGAPPVVADSLLFTTSSFITQGGHQPVSDNYGPPQDPAPRPSYVDASEGPAVNDRGLYLTGGCHTVSRTPLVGGGGWAHSAQCTGGPNHTAVVHDGLLWSRDDEDYGTDGRVYRASDGKRVGSFHGNAEPPVFDGHIAITVQAPRPGTGKVASTVVALDEQTQKVLWKRHDAGSAMAVAGHVVYVQLGRTTLAGLSTRTGRLVWKGDVGGDVLGADYGGISIGDGLLAVPTRGLEVFGR